jgi:hypothetical protein
MSSLAVNIKMTNNLKSLKGLGFKLFKSGMTYEGYVDYINKKMDNELNADKRLFYRYKDLNTAEIEYLHKHFKKMTTHFENKKTMKYEDIKFKHKQNKNYNSKKNALIETHYLDKVNQLNNMNINNENIIIKRDKLYNLIYQYNKCVPNTFSRETMRTIVQVS